MADSGQKTLDPKTVLLLGSAGSGKSFVGNILLSRTSDDKNSFKERPGPRIEERVRGPEIKENSKLKVIETFDLMSSSLKEEEYETQMEEWLKVAHYNIDVVIMVIRGDARYTKYNHDLYTCFEKYWMKKMDRPCPLKLVFTAKDILTKNDIDIKNETEKDTISSELKELKRKAEKCEFVGKVKERNEEHDQNTVLVEMIETTYKKKKKRRWLKELSQLRNRNPSVIVTSKHSQPSTSSDFLAMSRHVIGLLIHLNHLSEEYYSSLLQLVSYFEAQVDSYIEKNADLLTKLV